MALLDMDSTNPDEIHSFVNLRIMILQDLVRSCLMLNFSYSGFTLSISMASLDLDSSSPDEIQFYQVVSAIPVCLCFLTGLNPKCLFQRKLLMILSSVQTVNTVLNKMN